MEDKERLQEDGAVRKRDAGCKQAAASEQKHASILLAAVSGVSLDDSAMAPAVGFGAAARDAAVAQPRSGGAGGSQRRRPGASVARRGVLKEFLV